MKKCFLLLFSLTLFSSGIAFAEVKALPMTAEQQSQLTPNEMLARLKAGNERYLHNRSLKTSLAKNIKLTVSSQHPGAIVLSCIDSRVPPEIVFDQNVGNIFVSRVAANVLNSDILGGLEYATKVAGAKLIVVMGHDNCGAVRGACDKVALGHITGLVNKVQPAIAQATKQFGKRECNNPKFIDAAAADNVRDVIQQILKESPIIAKLVKEGKVKIVGAMYHLDSGKVTFLK